ncbi:MAG: hypothetical protein JKY56_07860, partial [Kofleriaceae bacterium]|nr:hypothetical protein [Kofleriaceae bacterium]
MHLPNTARLPLFAAVLVSLGFAASVSMAAPALQAEIPAPTIDSQLLSMPMPACDSPDCWYTGEPPTAQGVGLRTVYLIFEGVTLTMSNQLRRWLPVIIIALGAGYFFLRELGSFP